MPVFRTEKVRDYAVIAKHHLKNRELSYMRLLIENPATYYNSNPPKLLYFGFLQFLQP